MYTHKFNINELFVDYKDPLAELGIGTMREIDDFIKENDEYNQVKNGILTKLEFILNACNDREKAKIWIEYLLETGAEKIENLEYEDIYEMINLDIKFAPYLKNNTFLDENIKFIKKNNKYYLKVKSWCDFVKYINSEDLDSDDICKILEYDSNFFYNYYYYEDFGLNYICDVISGSKEENEFFNLLKDTAIKYANTNYHKKEIKKAKDIYDIVKIIEDLRGENEKMNNIIVSLKTAFNSFLAVSEEDAAHNHIVNAIKRGFSIIKEKYISDGIILEISEQGLEDLFRAYYDDDYKIEYRVPHYGYEPDNLDVSIFLEEFKELLYLKNEN